MTLKKRLIICLSAVLACLLFACGGGEGGKEDPVHIGVSGVELSETSYSMVVGDSLLLKAVITPSDATDQTVNWDSSEESVAVVSSSGLVSAVGKGTCVITASVDGKSARCTITVQDKTIAVESIVLSEDTLLLGIDDTATLIATIRPENATEREITWTSSNPEIATVSDQGEVVALQEGTCTVTVSAGGKSAECVVTVSRNVIPVKEVILSETSLTLKEGESYTLTATVTPADATERTVTWKSGNPDVATISDEGKIDFCHNPFSMPQGGLEALETEDPLDVLAYQFDLVCNGYESMSGAVRNHDPEIMVKAFEIAGYTEEDVKNRFGALYKAFQYGTPPHAGAAPGLDRLIMLLADSTNIREVIAFPKNKKARDLLMGAPSHVTKEQLDDVHIQIKE